MFSLVKYFVNRSISNLKGALLLNVLTIVTVVLTMLILSAFLLVFYNVNKLISSREGNVEISVYLGDDIKPNQLNKIKKAIQSRKGVANVRHMSKEDAKKTFLGWNKNLASVVEKISENPFPASFEVSLDKSLSNPAEVRKVASDISKFRGVESVDYSSEWLEKLSTFMKVLRGIGIFVLAFLVVITVFLVSNTIRLNIYSRRDEISIMRIVGGTDLFIKIPFLIEGFFYGFVGSISATFLLFLIYKITCAGFESSVSYLVGGAGLEFIPRDYIFFILFLGILIGLFGSNFAVRRFLGSEL